MHAYAEQYDGEGRVAAEDAVHAALPGTRLLVPVVAMLDEAETDEAGRQREKSSDMAVPTIEASDGRRALPAFSSVEALSRWSAEARPVAVRAHEAARAALQERADTLLLDLGGPAAFPVAGARLFLLARGGEPIEPLHDPAVADAVRTRLEQAPSVRAGYLEPGSGSDLTLRLVLVAGLDRDAVRQVAHDLASELAADRVLRAILARGLDLALHPPGTPVPHEPLFSRG